MTCRPFIDRPPITSAGNRSWPHSRPGSCAGHSAGRVPAPSPKGEGAGTAIHLDSLREQAFPRLGILHEDRADRTVFRRLQDLLYRVSRRIHRFGLPVGIELKHLRGKSLAHRIAHAHVVVYPDAQFTCHDTSLIPGHWQGFERTESDAG